MVTSFTVALKRLEWLPVKLIALILDIFEKLKDLGETSRVPMVGPHKDSHLVEISKVTVTSTNINHKVNFDLPKVNDPSHEENVLGSTKDAHGETKKVVESVKNKMSCKSSEVPPAFHLEILNGIIHKNENHRHTYSAVLLRDRH